MSPGFNPMFSVLPAPASAPAPNAARAPLIHRDSVLLFSGDSTTSADRVIERPDDLGGGFAFLISATLQEHWVAPNLRTFNRGIAGETIAQLEAHFARDLDEAQPSVVTLLIGVNDICRRFEGKPHASPGEFAACYRRLLAIVARHCGEETPVILMEPFLLALRPDLRHWRAALDEMLDALRDFAAGHGLPLIPLDTLFAQACSRAPASFWLWDGIHPTPAGCALISRAWLNQMQNS